MNVVTVVPTATYSTTSGNSDYQMTTAVVPIPSLFPSVVDAGNQSMRNKGEREKGI